MNVVQKSVVRLILVKRYSSARMAISPKNRVTPPPKPVPSHSFAMVIAIEAGLA